MTRNSGNSFFAFLLGTAVGAGLALLYAPSSGSEARRRIKEGFEDAGDWTRDRLDEAKHTVTEGSEKVKQIFEEKRDDLKASLEAGKEAYHKGKERLIRQTS